VTRPLVILNPAAAGGRAAGRWGRIAPLLRARFPGLDLRVTSGPGDGERWAEEMDRGFLLVAGGDGSVHEVLNGIMRGGHNPLFGILPLGSGNDAARNLGLPLDPAEAIRRLEPGRERRVDLGRCRFREPDGTGASRGFINSVSLGLGARASRIAARFRGLPLGGLRYRLAGLAALATARYAALEVGIGAERPALDRVLHLSIANGACFGGGLRISPDSEPDDGVLELVTVQLGRLRAAVALAGLKGVEPDGRAGVAVRRLRGPVTLYPAAGEPVAIELDGEHRIAAGELAVELLPGRLRIAG
jgi:YegS/Rv2252/BmrU family lipid kinase